METNIPAVTDPETDSSPLTKATEFPLFLKASCLVGCSLLVPHPASEGESFLSAKRKTSLWVSKY